jgi:monoamine oxidase
MEERTCDTCVVGAGFAGLQAARTLVEADKSVIVLEARDRVGGRANTTTLEDGTPVDLGGQWIGPGQDRIGALAREVGVETFQTYGTGKHVFAWGTKTKRFTGTIPPAGPYALAWLGLGWSKLDKLALQVPLDAPWEAPQAHAWDAKTVETFLQESVRSETARKLFRIAIEAVFACDAGDVSLLHALFYIHSAGKLDLLLSTDAGAQKDRFVTGAQSVAERLAEKTGATIERAAPARRIEQTARGVVVTSDRVVVHARRVIVAIPPTLAGRIDYAPALPALRDQLTQRVPQGSVIKCFAVYPEAFWRNEGLTGQSVYDEGPVHVTFDASPPSGKPGILMGFLEGRAARRLSDAPESERRDVVLRCFQRLFGDRAAKPERYVDKAWATEPFTRGCYAGFLPPGVWTSFGPAMRAPVGRVHWAGTETATVWCGYFDGALQSGERAAREVIAAKD